MDSMSAGEQAAYIEEKLEQEEAEVERADQWRICKKIYKEASKPYLSHHIHNKGNRHSDWDVRDDLFDNNCRMILKNAGLWEYE